MSLVHSLPRPCFALVLLALGATVLAGGQAAPQKKTAVFRILVPADAVLEINNFSTQTTGEIRRFQSPPVEVGQNYGYPIRATWKGKTITRLLKFRPDEETTLDLRDAWTEAPAPPQIELSLPPELTVKAGEQSSLPVTIKRTNFKGPVTVQVKGLPVGVKSEEGAVPPGEDERKLRLSAAATALPGTQEVAVIATGAEGVSNWGTFRLKVEAPPLALKASVVPPTAPPPTPAPARESSAALLVSSVPTEVVLESSGRAYIQVRVQRADGSVLEAEPSVTLEIPSAAGVKTNLWTVSPAGEGGKRAVLGFVLRAEENAFEGKHELRAIAQLAQSKVSATVPLSIKRSQAVETKSAAAGLSLVVPPEVTLPPGGSAYVQVRVRPANGGELNAVPEVVLTVPEGRGLRADLWAAFPQTAKTGNVRDFLVRAAADAAEGEANVEVTARLHGATVSRTFKVHVTKSKDSGR
jgi:uncharacterized protein (TIGR03000 family)